jgi:hypothetical protein
VKGDEVPLSEHEQNSLRQLAQALAAEDPKLADTLRGTSRRFIHRRVAALAGLGFIVGLAALIGGMEVGWIVSVLGFIAMLASTIIALLSWREVEVDTPQGPSPSAAARSAFIDMLDERRRHHPEDEK